MKNSLHIDIGKETTVGCHDSVFFWLAHMIGNTFACLSTMSCLYHLRALCWRNCLFWFGLNDIAKATIIEHHRAENLLHSLIQVDLRSSLNHRHKQTKAKHFKSHFEKKNSRQPHRQRSQLVEVQSRTGMSSCKFEKYFFSRSLLWFAFFRVFRECEEAWRSYHRQC